MRYIRVNPAFETLMFGIYIEALENGTGVERHIIRTAINSIYAPQQEPIWRDEYEDFPGFDIGSYEQMCVKFANMRLTRTFFRAIRRELKECMPQIYMNANGQVELPNDIGYDDAPADDQDIARVKIIKTNYGLYHSLTFVFSSKQDRRPFVSVKVNINTDVYTTLQN